MNEFTISDEEWNQRQLCCDESCIGVIGPDGRCKECGTQCGEPVDTPVPVTEAVTPPPASESTTDDAATPNVPDEQSIPLQPDTDTEDDWASRRLCADGNCIGVIGPDGRCKECGKSG